VIEIDGARHDFPEAQLHDLDRTAWLNSQGYRVLRFRNEAVLADPVAVAEVIEASARPVRKPASVSPRTLHFDSAATPPSPALPPSRGKGDVIRPAN
jgi:hypothetical protein